MFHQVSIFGVKDARLNKFLNDTSICVENTHVLLHDADVVSPRIRLPYERTWNNFLLACIPSSISILFDFTLDMELVTEAVYFVLRCVCFHKKVSMSLDTER